MAARRFLATALFAAAGALAVLAAPARAAGEGVALPGLDWSFDGVFGHFDRAQVQRGLQVYLTVCSGCHSLNLIAYRNLAEIGYSVDEIKAIAAQYEVEDGPNDDGEMYTRPARPSDYFVPPFANTKAAAAANNGAVPPDLSLITKAREGGADYVHALMIGYEEDPGDHEVMEGLYFNPYFPGQQLAMPQPLYGDDVTYADGTATTIDQEARDVAAFLAWTGEPNLEVRKRMGMKVILFTIVLTLLLYASKRKVWRNVHH